MLQDFDFISARTLDEALAELAERGLEARVIAGGTNLLVNLRSGKERLKLVVDISRLRDDLGQIRRRNETIAIGALATLADVLDSPVVAEDRAARVLVACARDFANPLIRNRATIGGNVIDGSPAADAVPPLLALGARLRLVSQARGERVVPLDQFYLDYRKHAMAADEILTAVEFPAAGPRTGTAWYKLGLRKADAISIASAACLVTVGEDGRCSSVRIGLGAVAPVVMRAEAAERALVGARPDDEAIRLAGAAAAQQVRPIDDVRASAAYRRLMSDVLVRRTLRAALARASDLSNRGDHGL